MQKVSIDKLNNLRSLFKEIRFHMGYSVLDGKLGEAYVNDLENPSLAFLLVSTYCFINGNVENEKLKEVMDKYNLTEYTVIPGNNLKKQFYEIYGKDIYKRNRYSIKKNPKFDFSKLIENINKLSNEFVLEEIDSFCENKIKKENLLSITKNYEEDGLGVVCMNNSEIIGICSSNIVYKDGIEVNIEVKEKFQRRGIALAMASKLILMCLERNKKISWDAYDLNSVALAEKLGFELDSPYEIFFTDEDNVVVHKATKCRRD